MGLAQAARNGINSTLIGLRHVGIMKGEVKNLLHRKAEWKDYQVSEADKKQTDDFFCEHYGKKVPLYLHRMYSNYTGHYDKRYFPEYLFSTKLEEKLNPYRMAKPLGNKCFNPQYLFEGFSDIAKVPELICMNVDGILWGANHETLSQESQYEIVKDSGEVIIKPTIESMGGRGVHLYDIIDGKDRLSGAEIKTVLAEYKKDYVIQRRVIQHEQNARLNPSSVNTLRIITFICDGQLHVAPVTMRIGIQGRIVDNGGVFIGVSEEGCLYKCGFSKKGITKYLEHPDTHIKFEGYQIAGYDQMVNAAKVLHSKLPQLKMLSWDMAYDRDGSPVIIECNTTGQSVWFPQMVTGKPIFGEYTGKMLELIRK